MRTIPLLVLCALAPSAVGAQGMGSYVVNGQVIDELSLAAIPMVRITITATTDTLGAATSDSSGRFSLTVSRAGDAQLHLQRLGYQRDSVGIVVNVATAPVNVALAPRKGVALTPRVVTAQRSAFDTRAKRGVGGMYFRRAEIEKMSALQTTDVLRHVNGLTISGNGGGAMVLGQVAMQTLERQGPSVSAAPGKGPNKDVLLRPGTRPSGCVLRTVLDGHLMHEQFSVNEIPVSDVEGIEVYRSAGLVPAEFATSRAGSCGLIVIWLKAATSPP